MNDTDYMNLALELARRGMGWTSPNPMVGAVLVKNGEIIGQGWHTRYGELHAEREALKNCTGSPAGATLYVTLEPCCHQGRQPPCTQAILDAKSSIACCPICQNLTEGDGPCAICRSPKRDAATVCVVADPKDVIAMERSREYGGLYHVLHGVISPMNHVGPDDLHIKSLVERVGSGGVQEVIMATNPDTEGEATAMYLSRLLKPFSVKVTRLAYGIPVGSHLEFADDATLMRALEGRREM